MPFASAPIRPQQDDSYLSYYEGSRQSGAVAPVRINNNMHTRNNRSHPHNQIVPGLRFIASNKNIISLHTINTALSVLASYTDLAEDWDTYGGQAITAESIRLAHRLIISVVRLGLNSQTEDLIPEVIAPMPDGGIHLEWIRLVKEIEVNIGPQSELGYLLIERKEEGREFTEDDNVSWNQIINLIEYTLAS